MNLAEHIAALEAARAAKAKQLEEITEKSVTASRSMSEEEQSDFDEIEAEIKSIDEDLTRLRRLERIQAEKAAPIEAKSAAAATNSRAGGPIIHVPKHVDDAFEGQSYTRMVIAKTLAQIDGRSALAIAHERWGKSNPMLVDIIKADVQGAGTTAVDSESWGMELAAADSRYTGDFIEYLYARTIYNQLPLRTVPENIVIKGQDGAATGYWVGESAAIPVTALDFFDIELKFKKVAAISVMPIEWLRNTSPDGEMLVRDGLVNAASQRLDSTFLGTAGGSTSTPAGMLNGVTPIGSTGTDGDAVRADISALYAPFIAARNASGLMFVSSTGLAKSLQLMRNALGQQEFQGVTQTGGTLEGDRMVTGDNVNASHLILLKPSDIYRIGNRGVQVSVSREASIEMDSAPAQNAQGPTAPTGKVVSMFQTDNIALKVVVPTDFAKRRAHAVQYINDADYGAVSSA